MEVWSERYGPDARPTEEQISAYIGSGLWEDINAYLQRAYDVKPIHAYSKCSAQPGWNVKYQKAGRSLCILYPMAGYFIALVTIGERERPEAELLLAHCTAAVRGLYEKAAPFNGSRWLMINVTEPAVLEDVKRLIALRRAPFSQKG